MKPYYTEDGITIYHGDCREVLPQLSADFVWADPPYNVGMNYEVWNDEMPDSEYLEFFSEWIAAALSSAAAMGVYVPQKYTQQLWAMLGDSFRQIILSYSPEGAIRYGFVNQFSSILTNAKPVTRTKNVWHNCQMPGLGYFFREDKFNHPGYTSLDITSRIIKSFTTDGQTVIDPFLGTGTTMRAVKNLGGRGIGIEINEKYCEIAVNRLRQSVLPLEAA